ncbi:MAG TPA: alpha/beta hydrolase [Opitutaceae bacterium]|nr:alpha/beta hydrolase [Opitutaceae bacterium]
MKPSIIFIHGMFLNPKSWRDWRQYFEAQGYRTSAPAWPLHDGDPFDLRNNIPMDLGKLTLEEVVQEFANIAARESERPILIGHSLGGLIVQRLVDQDLACAGVCISSVAPNGMMSADWHLLKNTMSITNPLKGDRPYIMTEEGFYQNFGNSMSREESNLAYTEFAVHESRNVLRDTLGKAGRIDVSLPHVPLLFIAGDQDHIIPDKLNKKNAEAYTDTNSIVEFKLFSGRSHFIYDEENWQEIANYTNDWLSRVVAPKSASI